MSSSTVANKLAHLGTRYPRRALFAALIGVGLLAIPGTRVGLDNDFSRLYATTTEADAFRLMFRETFGANDGLLIAVFTPDDSADPAFFEFLSAVSDETAKDPQIAQVFSLTNTALPLAVDDDVVFTAVFGPKSLVQEPHEKRLAIALASPLLERLASKDGKDFVLAAEVSEELRSFERLVKPAYRFRARIENRMRAAGLRAKVAYGGIPETRIYATEALEGDLFRLAPFIVCVLALLLYGFVRSAPGVMVTMLAIGLSCVATAGVIGLLGDDLNFLTVLYPIFIATIVTAHSVHLLHQYRLERIHKGQSPAAAATSAAMRVTSASLLTSITTAIGFGSLLVARATVLRTFGAYLSIAVIISFIVTTVVIPAAMVVLGDRIARLSRSQERLWFSEITRPISLIMLQTTKARIAPWVIAGGVLVFIAAIWSSRDVEFNYVLSDHAQRGSEIRAGNQLLDRKLGGTVPIEVSLLGRPGDFVQPANLRRMERCAEWLKVEYGVPTPIGLSTVLRQVSKSFGAPDEVPKTGSLVAQLMLVAESSPDRIVPQLVTDDRSHARLRTASVDRGANYIVGMREAFDEFARSVFAGTGIRARMTGDMVVGYEGINRLTSELFRSVGLALILVLVVIGVAFRSFPIALASVLPNVLPVAVGLALLNATDSVINPMPGIVFCLGIGLSVDDTIHLIARYKGELEKGRSSRNAAAMALTDTRGALVVTTLVVSVGLSMLAFSTSDLNQTMSWLAGVVLITALAADLFVTPAVLSSLATPTAHLDPCCVD